MTDCGPCSALSDSIFCGDGVERFIPGDLFPLALTARSDALQRMGKPIGMAEHFGNGMPAFLHRTLFVGQAAFLVRLHVHNLAVFHDDLDRAAARDRRGRSVKTSFCVTGSGSIEAHAHRAFADQGVIERLVFPVAG